jgi:large repetitive protein
LSTGHATFALVASKQIITLLVPMIVTCGCAMLPNKQQTKTDSAAIRLVPSSGKGPSAVVKVSLDPAGALQTIGVLYNSILDGRAACYIFYNPAENTFGLVKDSGDGVESLVAGKPLVENGQCALAGAGNTRAEIKNHRLALSLAITFKPAFAGPKNAYVYVEYKDGRKPTFQQEGTWLVPYEHQTMVLLPASGEGQRAVFKVNLVPAGVVQRVGVLYNSGLQGLNACYIFYDPNENTFGLATDSGDGIESLIAGKPLVENGQCALAGDDNTRAEIKNHLLAISLAITFKPAFAGPKNAYVYVEYNDGRKPTLQQEGTWLVAP